MHAMADELPPPYAPPYAVAETVGPLVRRVLARNPSPFTATGTQSYVVGQGADVAVIDPGPNEPEHLAALIETIGEARVIAILCTHTHRDHSPLAAPLSARTGAPVVGCPALMLDDDGPRLDAGFDPEYRPDRVLGDGESLSGKDWTLTAVATPGHTSNHLCFALEETGALFTGDHVMGWSTSVVSPPDGDMTAYLDSLAKLYERKQDTIYYPAHGPAVTNPHQLVRGMIGHRRAREKQILRQLEDGNGAVSAMVPLMYKGLNPKLWLAAGRSVLAHLIDLEKRGLVRHEGGDSWKLA